MSIAFLESFGGRLLDGLLVTIQLVVLSLGFGGLLAIPLALARLSRWRVLRGLSLAYVTLFRGTPVLVQLYLLYYGAGAFSDELKAAGLWWLFVDAFRVAVLGFALNTAAYQAEILRGSILAVPRGQTEAALALGLTQWQAFRRVGLRQAVAIALRPYGNEVILLIKASAVASIITVLDLMGETRAIYGRWLDFQVYLWAAVLYLAVVELLRRVWDRLERYLNRHLVRTA